jgi:hypothetical protein
MNHGTQAIIDMLSWKISNMKVRRHFSRVAADLLLEDFVCFDWSFLIELLALMV